MRSAFPPYGPTVLRRTFLEQNNSFLDQIPLRRLFGEPDALGAAELPVQGAVLDGFGDVGEGDIGGALQVGDGAGDLQDAGIGP